jgi:cell division protein FtsB
MGMLSDMLFAQKRLWQQQREIAQLRDELATLRAQNASMREGMRRCVTCDYRIDCKQRQDTLTSVSASVAAHHADDNP